MTHVKTWSLTFAENSARPSSRNARARRRVRGVPGGGGDRGGVLDAGGDGDRGADELRTHGAAGGEGRARSGEGRCGRGGADRDAADLRVSGVGGVRGGAPIRARRADARDGGARRTGRPRTRRRSSRSRRRAARHAAAGHRGAGAASGGEFATFLGDRRNDAMRPRAAPKHGGAETAQTVAAGLDWMTAKQLRTTRRRRADSLPDRRAALATLLSWTRRLARRRLPPDRVARLPLPQGPAESRRQVRPDQSAVLPRMPSRRWRSPGVRDDGRRLAARAARQR